MIKIKRILSFMLVFLFCITPINTFAAELPEGAIVIEDDGYDIIYISSNNVVDVDKYNKELDLYIKQLSEEENYLTNSTETLATKPYKIGDAASKNLNKSTIGRSGFNSTINWDYIKSSKIDGNSYTSYSGIYGHNPDSISLTDKFTFIGAVISVNASGGSWSTNMSSATWTRKLTGTKSMTHSYSGVTCVGYDIYVKQQTTGEFEVGTATYTIVASDSKFL